MREGDPEKAKPFCLERKEAGVELFASWWGGALERAIPLLVGGRHFYGRYHYARALGKDPTCCPCSWEVELLRKGWYHWVIRGDPIRAGVMKALNG